MSAVVSPKGGSSDGWYVCVGWVRGRSVTVCLGLTLRATLCRGVLYLLAPLCTPCLSKHTKRHHHAPTARPRTHPKQYTCSAAAASKTHTPLASQPSSHQCMHKAHSSTINSQQDQSTTHHRGAAPLPNQNSAFQPHSY